MAQFVNEKRVPSVQVQAPEEELRTPSMNVLELINDKRKSFVSSSGMDARSPPLSMQKFLASVHESKIFSVYL